MRIAALLICFAVTGCAQRFSAPDAAQAGKLGLPTFDRFPAPRIFHTRIAPPILQDAAERNFRTVIRRGAKEGPNFAGHYTVVEWGCGTECIQAVVVDCTTGKVLLPPSPPFVRTGVKEIPALGYMAAMEDGGLSYRANSTLLVVQGCNRTDCGTYYYNLDQDRWHLLRTIHVCREDYGEVEAQCGEYYYKHLADAWALKTQGRRTTLH